MTPYEFIDFIAIVKPKTRHQLFFVPWEDNRYTLRIKASYLFARVDEEMGRNRELLDRRKFMGAASGGLGLAALVGSKVAHGAEAPGSAALPVYNIRDYRAAGDGVTLDTAALQAAINACTRGCGGVVFFPRS